MDELKDSSLHSSGRRSMAWMERGACRGLDPKLFYPPPGYNTRAGRKICDHCPVEGECLEWAIGNKEWFGTWGGVSEERRRTMIRLRFGSLLYGVLEEDDDEDRNVVVGRS